MYSDSPNKPAANPARRRFMRDTTLATAAAAAGAAGLGAVLPQTTQAAPMIGGGGWLPVPKAKGPRVVVVGGGTAGLTLAKYLKKENPGFDVLLLEKRSQYQSCFCSNLWYPDVVNMEYLANHSYIDAAQNNGYIYYNCTVTGVDRDAKRLYTNMGQVMYDFLAICPGIDYDFTRFGIPADDLDTQFACRQRFPGGWIQPTEQVSVRNKIQGFAGGTFVVTVPTGNYRCLPSPYERTCVIAGWMKKNRIKGKVLLLDPNPDIVIKAKGFHAAFDELYKDYVVYQPSTTIKGVDPFKKVIHGEIDDYAFDDATLYPGVQGAYIIQQMGLVSPDSTQREANIDPFHYNIKGDPYVYVSGDARPMGYSKSANTANTEAHYVAKVIASRAKDKDAKIPWESPETLCYSMVDLQPNKAIYVDAHYNPKTFGFANVKEDDTRSVANAAAYLAWGKGLYADMFT
ncbi:MAG: FAD-dependent oxidoreductase [Thiomonas sp.]